MTIKLKVYGTVKLEKRILRRHHYIVVIRDRRGRWKGTRKWSQKRPIQKTVYKEKYLAAPTGKEVVEKMKESVEEEQWIEYKVKTP